MQNKLQATVDIGSHSCILLIAAFEEVDAIAAGNAAAASSDVADEAATAAKNAANASTASSNAETATSEVATAASTAEIDEVATAASTAEAADASTAATEAMTAEGAAASTVANSAASTAAGNATATVNAAVAKRTVLVPKLQKVEVCRLGEDIYEHGEITPARIEELTRIMTKFRMDLHALGADLKAVAMTEAMRKAKNPEAVIEAVEKAIWVKPRVITGEEEGKLTYRSVKEWHGSNIVTIDIGGGSTELSNGETTFSIPVGALKMFKAMGPIPGPEYKKFIKENFKDLSFKGMTKKPVYLIGGTGTALAMVFLNKQVFDYKAIEGLEMSLSDLEAVTTRITNLSKELRAMLPGLENGRHEVIICGLFWLRSLLEKLRVETFRISTAGLRFGLLYPPEAEPEPKPKTKRTPPWIKKKEEVKDEE